MVPLDHTGIDRRTSSAAPGPTPQHYRRDVNLAIDVVTEYLGSFAGGDPDAIASHVAITFRNEHLSELGAGCEGRDEYRTRLPHFLAAFADRSYTIDDIVSAVRDATTEVVVRYRFDATYDGHQVSIPGVMWFSVRGREIAHRVDTWDSLTFLRQTGRDEP